MVAVAAVVAGKRKTSANILFNEGVPSVPLYPQTWRLPVTTIEIETTNGELIPVATLIVPTLATPIQNVIPIALSAIPHLHGLKPVTSDKNYTIPVLIGADYYWKFVQDTIIRGDGPTAQESKLGYLLSGPLSHSLSQAATSILL